MTAPRAVEPSRSGDAGARRPCALFTRGRSPGGRGRPPHRPTRMGFGTAVYRWVWAAPLIRATVWRIPASYGVGANANRVSNFAESNS